MHIWVIKYESWPVKGVKKVREYKFSYTVCVLQQCSSGHWKRGALLDISKAEFESVFSFFCINGSLPRKSFRRRLRRSLALLPVPRSRPLLNSFSQTARKNYTKYLKLKIQHSKSIATICMMLSNMTTVTGGGPRVARHPPHSNCALCEIN